jgi:hypothetical protein
MDGSTIMIAFLRKNAKLVFLALILLLAVIAYANFGFWKLWGIGCRPDPGPVEPVVLVDTWSKPLTDAGFKPADIVDPVHVPVDIPAGTPIIYGVGTVADSIPVDVIGVETPDGGKWIRVTVGGKPVHFQKLDWIDSPDKSADNNFSLLIAGALVGDGVDFAAGLAWEPLQGFQLAHGLADGWGRCR